MRTSEHVNKFRRGEKNPGGIPKVLWTENEVGMNGVFEIPFANNPKVHFLAIASDGSMGEGQSSGWEHVSIRARSLNAQNKMYERVPNWMEMCWLKELFWEDDECVVQFHPPKAAHVNTHPHVLHLWKFIGGVFPMPDKAYV